MKNKTDIQTKNQQIDQILQEQYDAETKILESALLNVAGKTSWDEFSGRIRGEDPGGV